jgi:hypothetical protein
MQISKGKFNFSGYPKGTHLLVDRKSSNWIFWNKVEPKREFKLEEDLFCSFSFKGYSYGIKIKKGFVYDGASIPQIAWSVVGSPFTGLYLEAATIHDAIYYGAWEYGRKLADEIFLFIMLEMGVSKTKAYTMFKSVRIGGNGAYHKRRNIDISEYLEVIRREETSQRLMIGESERSRNG